MSDSELPVLVRVPDDREAAMVVCLLDAHGIEAFVEGAYSSEFRAEAPGDVAVRVRAADFSEARVVLADAKPDRGLGS